MWILSTYVTSKGEGREGGERRANDEQRQGESREREREREYRRIY